MATEVLTSHPSTAPPATGGPGAADPAPAPPGADRGPSAGPCQVLAVGTPGARRERLVRVLLASGHEVAHAVPEEAAARIRTTPPDAVVALHESTEAGGEGVGDGGDCDDGLRVIRGIRAEPAGGALPLLMVTESAGPSEVAGLLRHGADDCVPESSHPEELAARIEAKLRRVPIPVEDLLRDPRTGLYSAPYFLDELDRELGRPDAARGQGVVAVVGVAEMPSLEKRLGPRVRREAAERLAGIAERVLGAADRLGRDESGHLLVLMPGVDEEAARRALREFALAVAGTRFIVADENVRLTPAVGWAPLAESGEDAGSGEGGGDRGEAVRMARDAAEEARRHGDLCPVRYAPWMRATARRGRHRSGAARLALRPLLSALSPLLTLVLGIGVPFALYQRLYAVGLDVTPVVYWLVVFGLLLSAVLIVLECLYSLDAEERPAEPAQAFPPASAVVAAYLPNEAATIVDTVESFLRLDYPGDLEVVLAYNTPHPLPVEDTLREMARRDPRLVLLPVPDSTSKAQNINAAVTRVRGEFVGIFDADHHPDPSSFRYAWHWLSHGYDVVQGHCLIRNGDSSRVARLVGVEFETIYAVSHPGRTRLYGFGVFGGSNGFWRTDLLARTRMHGSMLTEDIDSTMRALHEGARFAVDRTLISRELAPTMLRPLWNQRARWAQGWLQVSLKYLWRGLRSPVFSPRQKTGLLVLLGWREVQPWLTLQIIPVLLHSVLSAGGLAQVDWAVPVCLLATLLTMSAGLVQTGLGLRLAAPELRRRRRWFWTYLLLSTFFYTHFKNLVARQAHLKEALGDRQWRVTPRASGAASGAASEAVTRS
ncbi:glycosyltransferase [Streptomyces sp. ODS28]|uniref:glycosyltransferase n=1 Tax=Streptomyces sp. ODS28 TaxID=3136688 RepID=UPI0031EFC20F